MLFKTIRNQLNKHLTMKQLLPLFFVFLSCQFLHGQENDIHRLELYIGLHNPKPGETLSDIYSHKSIQPSFAAEYSLFRLKYTKSLALKLSATAGIYPGSFDNYNNLVDDEFSVLKFTNTPLGVRAYPFALHKNFEDLRLPENGGAIIVGLVAWIAKSFYLEGGISPAVTFKEAGYENVTRSPSFWGWGFNILDLNDDSGFRFRFDIGTRTYQWTNASDTRSTIKDAIFNFGLSFPLPKQK